MFGSTCMSLSVSLFCMGRFCSRFTSHIGVPDSRLLLCHSRTSILSMSRAYYRQESSHPPVTNNVSYVPFRREQALDVVAERASWRAHSQAVTSVQVFTRADVCCVMSTSRDCIVSLFTKEGVHIGDFGKDTWSLIEPSTWRSEEPEPAQDLEPGQDPTPEISAWITHATQGERIALVAKEQAASSGGMVLIDDDLVKKRRPREVRRV